MKPLNWYSQIYFKTVDQKIEYPGFFQQLESIQHHHLYFPKRKNNEKKFSRLTFHELNYPIDQNMEYPEIFFRGFGINLTVLDFSILGPAEGEKI